MKAWCTRISIEDNRVVFNLGDDKRRAQHLDRDVRARLIAGVGVSEVRAYLRDEWRKNGDPIPRSASALSVPAGPVADPTGQKYATFRDVIRVRAERTLEANDNSTRRYMMCLLNLVEGTMLHRAGLPPRDRSGSRVEYEDYGAILDLPISILDDILVADFKNWRLQRARTQKDDELSAKISANTEIRQARSVFSTEALLAYRSEGLVIPSLENFFSAPKFKKARRRRPLPHEHVIKGLHTGLAEIRDEGLFLAIALALHRGLRRGEIVAAHSVWLQRTTGPSLVTRRSADFQPKDVDERTIPLPEWLYHRLIARGSGYLIAATASERERIVNRAVEWVRAHGYADSEKPLHDMRALCAGYLLARHPILTVLDILGHEDIRTTITHYSKIPLAADLADLWDVVLPSHAAGTEKTNNAA